MQFKLIDKLEIEQDFKANLNLIFFYNSFCFFFFIDNLRVTSIDLKQLYLNVRIFIETVQFAFPIFYAKSNAEINRSKRKYIIEHLLMN